MPHRTLLFRAFVIVAFATSGCSSTGPFSWLSNRWEDPPEEERKEAPAVAEPAFTVVADEDMSDGDRTRLGCRVVLHVKELPAQTRIEETARELWIERESRWDDVTVYVYLPEMDTAGPAYAIADFTTTGLKTLRIQESALAGTRWQGTESAEDVWREGKRDPRAKEYRIDLDVESIGQGRFRIRAETDFPDGTMMFVSAVRTYYQDDDDQAYTGTLFRRDVPVEDGRIDLVEEVNDAAWYEKFVEERKSYRHLGYFSTLSRVSPTVKVSVTYSPMREQPPEVTEVLGESGELVKGPGAERVVTFTVFSASCSVPLPFRD